jgi:hypothetical protein
VLILFIFCLFLTIILLAYFVLFPLQNFFEFD